MSFMELRRAVCDPRSVGTEILSEGDNMVERQSTAFQYGVPTRGGDAAGVQCVVEVAPHRFGFEHVVSLGHGASTKVESSPAEPAQAGSASRARPRQYEGVTLSNGAEASR